MMSTRCRHEFAALIGRDPPRFRAKASHGDKGAIHGGTLPAAGYDVQRLCRQGTVGPGDGSWQSSMTPIQDGMKLYFINYFIGI